MPLFRPKVLQLSYPAPATASLTEVTLAHVFLFRRVFSYHLGEERLRYAYFIGDFILPDPVDKARWMRRALFIVCSQLIRVHGY